MARIDAWSTPIIHRQGYTELALEMLGEDLSVDYTLPVGAKIYWNQDSTGAYSKLVDLIRQTFKEELGVDQYLDIQGYIKQYELNDYHPYHFHAASMFTGIFYIQAGQGADIILHDPRGPATRGHEEHWSKPIRIHPQMGDLIIMPAYVGHEVTKHIGPGVRLCLPFDVRYRTLPQYGTQ